MVNCRFSGLHPLGRINLDHIESGLKHRRILAEIYGCGYTNFILLAPINILHCLRKIIGFSQLYFHENQILLVANNQINLAKTASIARCNDFIPLFTQIFCRLSLAPGAKQVNPGHRTSSKKSYGGWENARGCEEPHNEPWCHSPYVPRIHIPGTFQPFPA